MNQLDLAVVVRWQLSLSASHKVQLLPSLSHRVRRSSFRPYWGSLY
jgi:hypothetical protein